MKKYLSEANKLKEKFIPCQEVYIKTIEALLENYEQVASEFTQLTEEQITEKESDLYKRLYYQRDSSDQYINPVIRYTALNYRSINGIRAKLENNSNQLKTLNKSFKQLIDNINDRPGFFKHGNIKEHIRIILNETMIENLRSNNMTLENAMQSCINEGTIQPLIIAAQSYIKDNNLTNQYKNIMEITFETTSPLSFN